VGAAARQACAPIQARVHKKKTSQAHAKEEGVGRRESCVRTPSPGCKHGALPDSCVCLHTCEQPLDHALNRQRHCPAPSPRVLLRLMPVACNAGRLSKRGGLTGRSKAYHLQARASRSEHRALRPSCARPCHQNTNTDKPGTKSRVWGAGRGPARRMGVQSTLPKCTVCQAATTRIVHAK